MPDTSQGKPPAFGVLYAIAFVGLASVTFTAAAFLGAMGAVVPLSNPNLGFALAAAGVWGGIGVLPIATFVMILPRSVRLVASVLGAILWAAASGFFFYIWIAIVASC